MIHYLQKAKAKWKIKKQLNQIISEQIDYHKKGFSKPSQVQKSDLDSVEVMILAKEIELKWGRIELIELYKAQSKEDLIELIVKKLP